MWQKTARAAFAAVWLFISVANAVPHGDHDTMDMGMDQDAQSEAHAGNDDGGPMSYFAYGKHSGAIVAHISLMVLAWCFILPIGEISPRLYSPS